MSHHRCHEHAEYDDQEQLLEQRGVNEIHLVCIGEQNQAEFAALR